MGDYLLDTHAAIWFFNGSDTLSKTAHNIIRDFSNPIYISIVSVWELAIKIGIGKMEFDGKTSGFIRLAERNEITILPIKPSHLAVYESLPMLHRDPFDRLLIATAIDEQMTFISADKNIAQYDVPLIWSLHSVPPIFNEQLAVSSVVVIYLIVKYHSQPLPLLTTHYSLPTANC
jgi:PIN domain nuclease of toxin-antitoxin system